MSGMSLRSLLADWIDVPEISVSGICLDSRQVAPGDLFVAVAGTAQHGIRHAQQAMDRGAYAILSDQPGAADLAVPVLVLASLRQHLAAIAARFHGTDAAQPRLIGVTGTNGKTSSVQLIAQALSRAGCVVGSIGTLGSGLHGRLVAGERTTPDVFSTHAAIAGMQAQGADHVAMEVSSHALEQDRVAGLRFEIAAFSNLSHDHLDYHGSMSAYAAAKAKLFAWPGLAAAVINVDDPVGARLLAQTTAGRRIAFSAEGNPAADLRAEDIVSDAHGTRFRLVQEADDAVIQSALLGRFNVANLLLVAGVLRALGWSFADTAAVLASLQPVHGRMNRLGGEGNLPLVVIDYAHTPDALEKALSTLRAHTAGQLICVFGCGGDRDRDKRPLMGAIADRGADIALITDDNPRSEDGAAIASEILAGMAKATPASIVRDRRTAIRRAIAMANHGDTVLIAGKGHEPYQEVDGVKQHFDDTEEAAKALTALAMLKPRSSSHSAPGMDSR